jgi:DnaJ-domain-containing protein 1
MSMAPPRIRLLAALRPRACAIALGGAGALAGWFGLAAGLVIGFMLDIARGEAKSRAELTAYFAKPEGPAPPEPVSGYAAAACLALRGDWPGLSDADSRRSLFARFSIEALGSGAKARREAERIVDVASRRGSGDLPGLARRLATEGGQAARSMLSDWAFALAALGGGSLDASEELALRASLADCGLGSREILASRLKAFPGIRDPWTVLGLAPGASQAEVKKAYRRLCRTCHPDARPEASPEARSEDEGGRFRELSAAYAELSSRPLHRA